MFIIQRKLIDNLYYKGYNPKLVLCNLKQDRIIRISSKNESMSSPKNGIFIIKFVLEDRWFIKKSHIIYWDLKEYRLILLSIQNNRKLMK